MRLLTKTTAGGSSVGPFYSAIQSEPRARVASLVLFGGTIGVVLRNVSLTKLPVVKSAPGRIS